MRRPCRTQDPQSVASKAHREWQAARPRPAVSVVAGANAADVIAEGVELTNPAAAAIAIVVVAVVVIAIVGGDRAADNRGADDAGADAPAQTKWLGLRLRGGGCNAARDGERGKGESGNFRLDRHEKLHHVWGGYVVVRDTRWTERLRVRFEAG